MGRHATYPAEIENIKMISIADLKRMKLLIPNTSTGKRSINWTNTKTGENTGSIFLTISTNDDKGKVIFDYKYRETDDINYTVHLVTRNSNLGKGLMWFFSCPKTGKVCRKLHLIGGYFCHRSANPNLMYQKQLESKKMREWIKVFGALLNNEVYEQLHKKHFKTHYKGKPTKKYLKLMKIIKQRENIDINEFNRSLII